MNEMKILIVCPYFYPAISFGGVATSSYNMCIELAKRNHDVAVFTSDAASMTSHLNIPTNVITEGVRIHYFRNLFSKSIGGFFITPDLIPAAKTKLDEFDVIHLQEFRTFQNIITSRFAKKAGTPYIIQPHGTLPRIAQFANRKLVFDMAFGNSILKYASAGIPMSEFEEEHFRKQKSWQNHLEIIPNSVNLQDFSKETNLDSFRSKYQIDDESKIVLFLGRLNHIKNISVLLKAFSLAIKEFENTVLIIAGPDDGDLENLRKLSKTLGIQKKVVFTGLLHFEDKLNALKACDFLVLPSKYEMFGTVILEAFACGKPVIGSNVGSTADLVQPEFTGYLFHQSNIPELAKHITSLLSSPEMAERLGLNGRKLVSEKYSIEHTISQLESLYEKVIKK